MSDPIPQSVVTPLTPAAIFLVLNIHQGAEIEKNIRAFCADLSALRRTVGFRDPDGQLSCILGIGSAAWDRLFSGPRPKELHPFKEIKGVHHAVSTSGDLLFHIRATRMDMCFEMATLIMERLRPVATVVDEVHGFKYFDDRDLIGFVDGTENPENEAACEAVLIDSEDPDFKNSSYVIVQKYLHDVEGWNKLPIETQEKIIGRKKLSNVELDDENKPDYAHNILNIVTRDGKEVSILRDNMPFGEIGKGEFGTYFIGYARSPSVTEEMLENMFVGKPKGNYDRLLDFSRPITGCLFFVPSVSFLDNVEP
ncbi:Dyp-type peroxidase [Zymomonas mobilis]|uniref:Dyp-type peroxidase family n=1 Tax=Zymomonas mobilis subsp. pomaceae (strain ATCC 29192 / DSM 22645 / JCM 10191 / CCUG 17912 / NBRC 13757 / NCIMB 11200 / NRRL B-4491 / Barker I) TaxID=579138 RepID=F8EUN9_ZYMMT|nr:Dyp-type peroxidase [Zymomonas mobilis]AEI38185.1 Dyp-type peroxidase family [Zymomonas mobilis subsp. pomaceae ATCC 29192]MDX5947875.1 Dyp-type peroxidase [Zymomonas mobilis subsp. pomaceae]GEB89961.1 peroxidase [Zymomonas mobilis subsp. pomaceae]